jgi:hypothetical protein
VDRRSLVFLISIALLVSCGSPEAPTQTTEETTEEATVESAERTIGSHLETLRMGATATFRLGDNVTVYSYTSPVQPTHPEVWQPKAGTNYAAIDVERGTGTEPGPKADEMAFNPFFFTLQMPDNTRIQPTVGVVEPALNATSLPLGDCVRGNVSFEVPQDTNPSYVVFENPPTKWAIP